MYDETPISQQIQRKKERGRERGRETRRRERERETERKKDVGIRIVGRTSMRTTRATLGEVGQGSRRREEEEEG